MKKVYTSENIMMVGHLKNVLEGHGIDCLIKNQYLSGGAGELPPTEIWPELWVTDDLDSDRARSIIDDQLRPAEGAQSPWTCPDCGEIIEPQFGVCWNCGTSRPVAREQD
ncbi:MAG: DUF2007 domain-containing protein [Gammaproteobacteria bacterium]